MAATVIRNFIAKALFKKKGAIANNKAVEFSSNVLEQRLRNLGIDPNAIRSEQELNQILSFVKQAEDQKFQQKFGDMLAGSKFDKQADVLDMTGKKIDPRSRIMGGKQSETEAEIAERISRENKESAKRFKDKMKDDPEDMAQGGRAGFANGSNSERLKQINEALKNKMINDAIKQAPGGVLMDPPPRPNYDLIEAMTTPKDTRMPNNIIEFDDGTVFFKDSGEYYKQDGTQVEGPSKGAKIKPRILEAAEGGRIGYKIGSIDKARRAFLKTMAAAGAGIGAIKTGLLNIGKGGDAVKNLPPIKTPVTKLENTTTQMPEWFPSFINKFRNEGKAENVFKQEKVEVTKAEYDKAIAEGKGENYFRDDARTPEYKANNPDHMDYGKLVDTDERIYTTYTNDKVPGVRVDDMDGNVDVMFENEYSQPVSLNYTAPGKRGPETGRADLFIEGGAKLETKPKGDFAANDVEVYATDPDGGFETVDVITDTVDDMLEGTTRGMEEYATGKKVKGISRGEGRVVEAEIRAEQASDAAAEAAAEEAAEMADEFASGGIARLLGE